MRRYEAERNAEELLEGIFCASLALLFSPLWGPFVVVGIAVSGGCWVIREATIELFFTVDEEEV
jgi:hypothetical protein